MQLFWVTDTRDSKHIRYDDELIDLLGVDRAKLPELRASTSVLGTLQADSARQLGLADDVAVVCGSPDHQCALLGSGATRPFETHLYVGTSSWIECLVPFRKTDPLHSIAAFPTFVPGVYQCINEQDLAGGALEFLRTHILERAGELLGAPAEGDPYELIERVAAEVPPGSGGVLFTPWLNGERTPVDDHHARGAFSGISTTTRLDELTRAVLEGVASNTRWSLGYVERFARRRLDPIRIIGGGAQSDLWCQIFADVLQRTIRRVVDPRHANARGAAFLAGLGLDWITLDQIPELVPCDRSYEPDAANAAVYDALSARLVAYYRANRKLPPR
jgi:xylulokinase